MEGGDTKVSIQIRPMITALVVVVAFAGCDEGADNPASPAVAAEIPQGAAPVSYAVIEEVRTPISGIADRRRLVIRDEAAWTTFWSDFTAAIVSQPGPPSVDFSTHMVIAATMGRRTSGGYTIAVEEVAEKDGTLYAAVQEVTPGVLALRRTS